MKSYTFKLAPIVESDLESMGYDCRKLQEAVESDGNANLVVVDSKSTVIDRYIPERTGVRTGKPASSTATATVRTRYSGNGNLPREFAGWHRMQVQMIAFHGPLSGPVVLPTRLKAWLDHTFKKGEPVELSAPKGNRRERRKGLRTVTVAAPAATVPGSNNGNGNGTPVASE